MTATLSLGLDFGTTNTVAALAGDDGVVQLLRYPAPEGELFAFRSTLSFQAPPGRPRDRVIEAGPWAVEAYVEDPGETRFIQSFKAFAASSSFTETRILERRYRFEDLLSTFLLKLRDHAGPGLADLPTRVIVGRPVVFAGAAPDPALALTRYETALRRLGFQEILYAFEPVGAAFFFARRLDGDATVLVGDFGGGTSDFSVIRFEQKDGAMCARPLGRSGVGVAGDAFDYRIIDNLVSPHLGKGGEYQSIGKLLPVPNRYYSAFARWDQLALMRGSRDMAEIRRLQREAVDPDAIGRLVQVLDENLGFPLYRSVSRLKVALSQELAAEFHFEAGSLSITRQVTRADFERWIEPELTQIERAIDAALADAELKFEAIDKVFLTGGSSLTPAVRRLFANRFDPARIETGAELESIASGLAMMGREGDLSPWTEQT